MTSNKFAEILAELDATLKKLEQAHDVKERRNILLTLRLLIKEAD
jgi:hypothetical protein